METQTTQICETITQAILKKSEGGLMPWQIPWGSRGIPHNLITKKPFRGINAWLLNSPEYPTNCYITHKQARENNVKVRRGEVAHIMLCQPEGCISPFSELSLCKAYNVAQCDGIAPALLPSPTRIGNPIAICEEIIATMPNTSNLLKEITVKTLGSFSNAKDYYSQLFQKLVEAVLGHVKFEVAMSFSHRELSVGMGTAYLTFFAGYEEGLRGKTYNDMQLWKSLLIKNCTLPIAAAHCAQLTIDNILGYFTDDDLKAFDTIKEITPQKTRSLKVYYSPKSTRFRKRPMIRLSGNYLEDAGFAVGDRIEVGLNSRQIVISKL